MGTQAGGARRLLLRETLTRHETLAMLLDQRDQRHGNVAQARGEFHDLGQFAIVLYRIRAIGGDHAAAQPLVGERGIGGLVRGPEGIAAELHRGCTT